MRSIDARLEARPRARAAAGDRARRRRAATRRRGVAEGFFQLLELALADVGAGLRPGMRRWTTSADRLDPRGARELLQLAELALGVDALRQHGERRTRARARRPAPGSGWRSVIARDYARFQGGRISHVRHAEPDGLAERTLALVDIPSSQPRARLRRTARMSAAGCRCDRSARGDDVLFSTRERRPAGRSSCSRATVDTVPGAGQPPGPDRGRRRGQGSARAT